MFKYFITLTFVIVLSGCMATEPFKPVAATNIYEAKDQSKDVIYDRSRQWFSEYFVSGESVIDYEDKVAGTIIGAGIANTGTGTMGLISQSIKYSIRVDTKDNKFKVVTTIIKHMNTDSKSTYDVAHVSKERIAEADAAVDKVASALKEYVLNKTSSQW